MISATITPHIAWTPDVRRPTSGEHEQDRQGSPPPRGWYRDRRTPGQERYWNGTVDHRRSGRGLPHSATTAVGRPWCRPDRVAVPEPLLARVCRDRDTSRAGRLAARQVHTAPVARSSCPLFARRRGDWGTRPKCSRE